MNTPLTRRAALAATLGLAAAGAFAQGDAFPSRPVNLVTAFAAGSGPDAVLRQVGDKLSKLWGQPITVAWGQLAIGQDVTRAIV